MLNPYVIGGSIIAFVLYTGGVGYLSYSRGKDDQANYQLKVDLAQARKDLKAGQKNTNIANTAGANFEAQKPIILTQVRERVEWKDIPPDADPFLPVWFVRMQHNLASNEPQRDPYPGEPDGALSTTRLSRAREVLTSWAVQYETCRKAVDSIRELKPVLPAPPEEKSFFQKLDIF